MADWLLFRNLNLPALRVVSWIQSWQGLTLSWLLTWWTSRRYLRWITLLVWQWHVKVRLSSAAAGWCSVVWRLSTHKLCTAGLMQACRDVATHTVRQMLFINQTIPAKNQLEGLVVFHFSCQQIYSWFFHKQNRSEWVNNKILCSLIYNYLYFQKKWIFIVHLQIRQLRL